MTKEFHCAIEWWHMSKNIQGRIFYITTCIIKNNLWKYWAITYNNESCTIRNKAK